MRPLRRRESDRIMGWFREPSSLLSLPSEFFSCEVKDRERAPPLAALDEAPVKKPKRKKKTQLATDVIELPSDRSSYFGDEGVSDGRCKATIGSLKCAVPYTLDAIDPVLKEESMELMIVEIRDPDGGPGWLDNRELAFVVHGNELEFTLYSLSALRRLVQGRVSFATSGRSRNLAKALYRLCEPLPGSKLQVTVVAVSDLETLPLVAGEVPPEKRSHLLDLPHQLLKTQDP